MSVVKNELHNFYYNMSTQKHADFVSEPAGDKPVEAIAGIGDKAKEILNERGFVKAYQLIGQFLILERDMDNFNSWLDINVFCMPGFLRRRCCICINEWCEKHLGNRVRW